MITGFTTSKLTQTILAVLLMGIACTAMSPKARQREKKIKAAVKKFFDESTPWNAYLIKNAKRYSAKNSVILAWENLSETLPIGRVMNAFADRMTQEQRSDMGFDWRDETCGCEKKANAYMACDVQRANARLRADARQDCFFSCSKCEVDAEDAFEVFKTQLADYISAEVKHFFDNNNKWETYVGHVGRPKNAATTKKIRKNAKKAVMNAWKKFKTVEANVAPGRVGIAFLNQMLDPRHRVEMGFTWRRRAGFQISDKDGRWVQRRHGREKIRPTGQPDCSDECIFSCTICRNQAAKAYNDCVFGRRRRLMQRLVRAEAALSA